MVVKPRGGAFRSHRGRKVTAKMSKIGFIGLGIMGKPMSRNLLKAGFQLVIYDIDKAPVEELKQAGAEVGASPMDVAAKTHVIITMLPNSPHVKAAVLGKDGVIEGAHKGSIVVDMSSITPIVSRKISEALRRASGCWTRRSAAVNPRLSTAVFPSWLAERKRILMKCCQSSRRWDLPQC
jgi:phosphoglycerate dehydrogenase-like enzyme